MQNGFTRRLDEADAPGAVAEVAVGALGLLFDELEPLMGRDAMHALYARSVQLSGAPLQAPRPLDSTGAEQLLAMLRGDLAAMPPEAGKSATQAVIDAFCDLLGSLIGAELTARITGSAWADRPQTFAQPEPSR